MGERNITLEAMLLMAIIVEASKAVSLSMQALCAVQSPADVCIHSMGPDIHAIEGNLSSCQGDGFPYILTTPYPQPCVPIIEVGAELAVTLSRRQRHFIMR